MGGDASIPSGDVQAELERILASKGFAGAGRLSRMLRYLVERTLAGEGDRLKEYAVGVEAFDRDEKYDPRIDSIVRVEAGRLRTKIDEYYSSEGAADAVQISLPRGGYVPKFDRRTAAPVPVSVPVRQTRRWITWPLTIGLASAVILAMWSIGGRSRLDATIPGGMTIAVLAFEQYSVSPEDAKLAAEITDGVTSELARLGTIGVASHTSAMQFAGARKPLKEIAQALHADVVLEGSITEDADGLRVTARMVDAATDRKMWVESFAASRSSLQDLERRIAVAASTAALSRRGVR
jgi:adenylate cyclase